MQKYNYIEQYENSFVRLLTINRKILEIPNLQDDQYSELLSKALVTMNVLCPEDKIELIISNVLNNSSKIDLKTKKILLLSQLYQASPLNIKKQAIEKMKSLAAEIEDQNPHPMKVMKSIEYLIGAIGQLISSETAQVKKEIETELVLEYNTTFARLETGFTNKDFFVKQKEAAIGALFAKVKANSSENLPKTQSDFLELAEKEESSLKFVNTLIDSHQCINKVLEIPKINNVEDLAENVSSSKKSNLLFFMFGFFGLSIETFEKETSSVKQEIFQFGRFCSEKGGLPYLTDISFLIEEENSQNINFINLLPLLDYKLDIEYQWDRFLQDCRIFSKHPTLNYPNLINNLIIIRAIKLQPNLLEGTVNIESIARELRLTSLNIIKDRYFVSNYFWFVKILTSSLPTNQGMVTEYRIAAWNWFKSIAEIYKTNVGEYEGVEKQMIYYFHDSPGPYHMDIMESYCDYLSRGDEVSYKTINEKLEPLGIVIPPNYSISFGNNLEKVLTASIKLLSVFHNLYGGGELRMLLEIIKNSESLPKEIETKLFNLISQMSKYELISNDQISQKMIGRAEIFSPEDYPLDKAIDNLGQIADLYQNLYLNIKIDEMSERVLDYLLIQNSLDGIAYKLIIHLSEQVKFLGNRQLISIFEYFESIMKSFVSNSDEKEFYYTFRDLKIPLTDAKRLYFITEKIQRFLSHLSDNYLKTFQNRVGLIKKLDPKVANNFTADLIRETTLFSISHFLENLMSELADNLNIERYHITSPAENTGLPIILTKEQMLTRRFIGNEIIIIDDIDTHYDLPSVAGIITKKYHPPLSHAAIIAREKEIAWFSPPPNEFDQILEQVKANPQKQATIVSLPGFCSLNISKIKKVAFKKTVQTTKRVKLDYELNSPLIIIPDDYSLDKVGSKAYFLKVLSYIFPGQIPKSVSIAFGFTKQILESNLELSREIDALRYIPRNADKELIEKCLKSIRDKIGGLELTQAQKKLINEYVSEYIRSNNLIVRSSTNCEDLPGHPAAGVYESYTVDAQNDIYKTILRVLSSFFTSKAWLDRRFANFDESTCYMSIIIQELINADYAFVIHSQSPLTNQKGIALVEIVPGLGESLVSGLPQFEGSSHKFLFNRKNQKVQRLEYATKIIKQTRSGEKYIDSVPDMLQYEEIPLPSILKEIFNNSFQMEKEIAKIKGYKIPIPQDVEGVIKNVDGQMKIFYVQTRNQVAVNLPTKSIQASVIQAGIIKDKYKIIPKNLLPKETFDCQPQYFGNHTKTNLIALWEESFAAIVGKGQVIVSPYGAMVYMIDRKRPVWKYVNDLDITFYILTAKNKYEAWLFEKNYFDLIKKEFIKRAKAKGLDAQSDPIRYFVEKAVVRENIIRNQSAEITFGKSAGAESFFNSIDYKNVPEQDEVTRLKILAQKVENYLQTKKISEEFNVYYSFKFTKNTDYGNLAIAAFIKAYLNNTKLFAPVFWDWVKTSQTLHEIFKTIGLFADLSEEEFIDKVIKRYLEFNLIPQIPPFKIEEVQSKFPEMDKYILEGWVQALGYYLQINKQIDPKCIIVRDHIDVGSISAALAFIAGQLPINEINNVWTLVNESDLLKVPEPTLDHLKSRLRGGDLYGAELLLLTLKNILKPVKDQNMTEQQAIRYLRSGMDGKSIVDGLVGLIRDLSNKNFVSSKKYSQGAYKQFENEYDKSLTLPVESLFQVFSKNKMVGCISDSTGIKDLEIKYFALPKESEILVQYSEVLDGAGKLRGYRYYNVGLHPYKKNNNLIGLMDYLSTIELIFRKDSEELSREHMWVAHTRPDVMITGPSCSDIDHCSIIPPEALVELIEEFMLYKKEKNIEFTALNYEKPLPAEFIRKIVPLVYSEKIATVLRNMVDTVRELRPNSDFINDYDSFLLMVKIDGQEKAYVMGMGDLKVEPITHFTSPRNIKIPIWDMTPKGFHYWLPYYGDEVSLQNFKKLLYENVGNLEPNYLIGKGIDVFYKRRFGKTLSISTKAEAIKLIKEAIRLYLSIGFLDRARICVKKIIENQEKDEILISFAIDTWKDINKFTDKEVFEIMSSEIVKICQPVRR